MRRILVILALFYSFAANGQFKWNAIQDDLDYKDGFKVNKWDPVIHPVTLKTVLNGVETDSIVVILSQLAVNEIWLVGSATAQQGVMGGNLWVQLNDKPSNPALGVSENDSMRLSNMEPGVYYLRFYNRNTIGTSETVYHRTVKIVVHQTAATPQVNLNDYHNVWAWQENPIRYKGVMTTLPAKRFVLDASHSVGATSFAWTQTEGPAVTILESDKGIAYVNAPPLGIYKFKVVINGNPALTKTIVMRMQDANKKFGAPVRSGAPKTFVIPPNNPTKRTDAATGRVYAGWDYKEVKKYIAANPGLFGGDVLMAGDSIQVDASGIDSVTNFKFGGYGGAFGKPVDVSTKTKDPIRFKGVGSGNGISFTPSSNVRDDTVGIAHVTFSFDKWRWAGTPYGFIVDKELASYGKESIHFDGGKSITASYATNVTFKGFKGIYMGFFQVKRISTIWGPGQWNRFRLSKIRYVGNWFERTHAELVYSGDTDNDGAKYDSRYTVNPRQDSVEFIENYLSRSGWDALQVSNSIRGLLIKNNMIWRSSTRNYSSQRQGTNYAANNNGRMEGNLIQNVKGTGLEIGGRDTNYFINNAWDSTIYFDNDPKVMAFRASSIYSNASQIYPEQYGRSRPVFKGNVMSRWGTKESIRLRNDGGGLQYEAIIDSNYFVSPTATTVGSLIDAEFGWSGPNNKILKAFTWQIHEPIERIGDPNSGATYRISVNGGSIQSFGTIAAANAYVMAAAKGTVINFPPTITAITPATTVKLPSTSTSLSVTATDDGSIVSYSWSRLTLAGTASITSPSAATTTVTGLSEGSHTFQVSITDNLGEVTTGTVEVTVKEASINQAPEVFAGGNATVALSKVTLLGSATDPEESQVQLKWVTIKKPVDAPEPEIADFTSLETVVSNLQVGIYEFKLTATDDLDLEGSDVVQVTVIPLPTGTNYIKVRLYGGVDPYLNAEWNNWNLAGSLLSGSLKYSTDIVSPVSATLSSHTLGDNGAAYGGTMAPPEVLRFSSFGDNLARTLTLSGLSANKRYHLQLYSSRAYTVARANNATVFSISGRADKTVLSIDNKDSTVTFLDLQADPEGKIVVGIKGTIQYNYLNGFVLTEIDKAQGAPVARAGADVLGLVLASTLTLDGSLSTDEDGTIASHAWSRVSGSGGTITTPTQAVTTVTGLPLGIYVFRLTVTDNNGATATDDITVVVIAVAGEAMKEGEVELGGGRKNKK